MKTWVMQVLLSIRPVFMCASVELDPWASIEVFEESDPFPHGAFYGEA